MTGVLCSAFWSLLCPPSLPPCDLSLPPLPLSPIPSPFSVWPQTEIYDRGQALLHSAQSWLAWESASALSQHKHLQQGPPRNLGWWEINVAVIAGQCFRYYALSPGRWVFSEMIPIIYCGNICWQLQLPLGKQSISWGHRLRWPQILPHASFSLFSDTLQSVGHPHL